MEDVVRALRFCRRHGIQVAARGQGHSTGGQAQVEAGLVVDMSTLAAIEHIGDDHVRVQGGMVWKNLLATTVPLGLHPPVLTGFVGLSVGGTLSMGGIGAKSFLVGAQVDNVLELEVVTGEGELLVCSRDNHQLLFDAVRGGVGQYGIIVRAKLPLVRVASQARSYVISYSSATPFFSDLDTLTEGGKIDGAYGQIAPDGHGGWVFAINANKFFEPGSPPDDDEVLSGLEFGPGAVQAQSLDTFSFDTLVDAQFAFLQSIGLLDIPHVWGDVFLPASRVDRFVEASLSDIRPADLGPTGVVLLFPILNRSRFAPALRLPAERKVFLFDVLTSGLPSDATYATTELAEGARSLRSRAQGGRHPLPDRQYTDDLESGLDCPVRPTLPRAARGQRAIRPGAHYDTGARNLLSPAPPFRRALRVTVVVRAVVTIEEVDACPLPCRLWPCGGPLVDRQS